MKKSLFNTLQLLFYPLIFFCFSITGMKAQTTPVNPKSYVQVSLNESLTIEEKSGLGGEMQTYKNLYQKAFNVSLSENEFFEKYSTTSSNLKTWKKVKQYYLDKNNTKNVALIEKLLNNMTKKHIIK